jgi:outer membrane protein assembly factor BamB
MKTLKNKTMAILIAALLIFSMFALLSNSATLSAKAQSTSGSTVSSSLINDIYAETTGNASRSWYAMGPGVTTPNLLWTVNIPGVFEGDGMQAFGGYVFVQNATDTIALDGATGNIVYAIPNILDTPVYIGGNYMILGYDAYTVDTGTQAWALPEGFSIYNSILGSPGLSNVESGVGFVTDPQYLPAPMFFNNGCGWELTNPAHPPTVLWNDTGKAIERAPYNGFDVGYDDGVIVYFGPYGQTFQGFNATTGAFLWSVPSVSTQTFGCTATMGVFANGAQSGSIYGWNITTGKLLYTFTPEQSTGLWTFSLGSDYGMIYGHNNNQYFYAINATTGKLVWDQNSPGNGVGYPGTYSTSGGYIYTQMGENQYQNPNTGKFGHSEFDCYNAYNGSLIWSLPYEDGAPFDLSCPAYGNLYMIPCQSSSVPNSYAYTSVFGITLGDVICLGSGSPQSYPMAFNDPEHTSTGWGPTNLTELWSRGWGNGGYLASAPSFANGIGYIGSSDNNIYAFNATNGDKIWNYTTNNIVQSTPAVANGYVYTGADDGNVYCLNAATGSKVWSSPLATDNPPVINAITTGGSFGGWSPVGGVSFLQGGIAGWGGPPSPILVNNNLYIGANNYLYCLNAATGAVQWKFTWGDAILVGTPVVADNIVYIAPDQTGPDGFLYELNAETGALLLNATIPYVVNPFVVAGVISAAIAPAGQGIVAPLAVDSADGIVFVQQLNERTFAINATSGAILWTYDAFYNPTYPIQWGTTNDAGPLYANGEVYFDAWYSIVALNVYTGNVTWNTYLGREDTAPLSISNENIYAVTVLNEVYVLKATNGQKESYAYVGDELNAQPVPYDGNLYIASGDFNVTCFTQAAAVSVTPVVTPTPPPSPTPTPTSPPINTQYIPPLSWTSFWTTIILVTAAVIIAIAIVGAVVVITLKKRPSAKNAEKTP